MNCCGGLKILACLALRVLVAMTAPPQETDSPALVPRLVAWLAGFRLLCWLQWVRFNGYLLTGSAVIKELFLELEKLGRLI